MNEFEWFRSDAMYARSGVRHLHTVGGNEYDENRHATIPLLTLSSNRNFGWWIFHQLHDVWTIHYMWLVQGPCIANNITTGIQELREMILTLGIRRAGRLMRYFPSCKRLA